MDSKTMYEHPKGDRNKVTGNRYKTFSGNADIDFGEAKEAKPKYSQYTLDTNNFLSSDMKRSTITK